MFKHKSNGRVFVLSIDGVPYDFMQQQTARGRFPNFKRLVQSGSLRRMNSVHPCISSVAWSSYMTGKNPGKHNIFGFVEKKRGSYDLFVPTSRNMKSETIWEIMSRAGKRVFVMNVPLTYPPRKVNGVMIGCFLCTQFDKLAYPPRVAKELKRMRYKIDADTSLARADLEEYLEDCKRTLEKRIEVMFHYMKREPWDFFHCHFMETDRVNHFFWECAEKDELKHARTFRAFYQRIDDMLGEVESKLDADCEFIVLSDHGFCSIKKEIYLNRYLVETGLLKFKIKRPKTLADIHPEALGYSLIPGRVFVNLRGREPLGSVPIEQYETAREKLTTALLEFKDAETGAPIIREVLKREQIYAGPHYEAAADLIAVPHDGYDLKGDVRKEIYSEKTALAGMHTFDDALLFLRHREIQRAHNELWIGDLAPTILKMMNLPIPGDMDGVAVV